jgi:hypothetical protein
MTVNEDFSKATYVCPGHSLSNLKHTDVLLVFFVHSYKSVTSSTTTVYKNQSTITCYVQVSADSCTCFASSTNSFLLLLLTVFYTVRIKDIALILYNFSKKIDYTYSDSTLTRMQYLYSVLCQ